jgi:uncharacterized membrane protein YjfL (UPF0719 family)
MCNLGFSYAFLGPLFSIRSGRVNSALSNDEVNEILLRAGNIRGSNDTYDPIQRIDPQRNEQRTDSREDNTERHPKVANPKTRLLGKVGLSVGFSDPVSPNQCVIQWFPVSRRPKPNIVAVTEQAITEQQQDSRIEHLWNGNQRPQAFAMILTTDKRTVSYKFSYGESETESRILLQCQNGPLFPIQPVSVTTDLHTLVAEFNRHIPQLMESENWRKDVFEGIQGNSPNANSPSTAEMETIGRALEGVLIQVFSHGSKDPKTPDPARDVPSLQDLTLPSCVLNGSNQLGWIQFFIGVVFVRGLLAVFASQSKNDAESLLAARALETLPALGFLGTLLGMAAAFANGLDDRNNLTQSLTLAIATSALALIGALAILWLNRDGPDIARHRECLYQGRSTTSSDSIAK